MDNQPTLFDTPPNTNQQPHCPHCHRPYTLNQPGKTSKTHPNTSKKAATLPKYGTQRHTILKYLTTHGPNTAWEISQHLPHSPNQIATRLQELRENGLVTYAKDQHGNTIETPTTNGNTALLQKATPLGHQHIHNTQQVN